MTKLESCLTWLVKVTYSWSLVRLLPFYLWLYNRGRTLLKKCLHSGYSPNQHAHTALLSLCAFRVWKDILKSCQKVHHDCPLTLVLVFQKQQCHYLFLCSEMLSFSFYVCAAPLGHRHHGCWLQMNFFLCTGRQTGKLESVNGWILWHHRFLSTDILSGEKQK